MTAARVVAFVCQQAERCVLTKMARDTELWQEHFIFLGEVELEFSIEGRKIARLLIVLISRGGEQIPIGAQLHRGVGKYGFGAGIIAGSKHLKSSLRLYY